MAAQFGDDGDAPSEAHEINVTPFIDVMLVLLIIFMVAAPLATVDVAVDLPTASAQPAPRPDHPIYLTLKADRSLAVGEKTVTTDALAAALDAASAGDKTQRVFLRGDKTVSYEALMDCMGQLRHAGYLKIALVAAQGDAAP
jgi:biopolymer transport protein ExbD